MSVHTGDTAPLLVIRAHPFNAETPLHALSEPVTPSHHVYVRSNFNMPQLDASHVIGMGGAVQTPYVLDMPALLALPQRIIGCTMECAGNDRLTMLPLPVGEPWSSGAVSTAVWSGEVPLLVRLLTSAPRCSSSPTSGISPFITA